MTAVATKKESDDRSGTAQIDPDLAAVAASLHGEVPDVLAVRTIRIACDKAHAVAVVQDMGMLTTYEQKARVVQAQPASARTGRYSVTGRLAGLLPWRGTFSYLLHGDGFHSADSTARPNGWRVSGGFVVYDVPSGGCEVMHYECYDLPHWPRPARRVLRAYMRNSQRRELHVIHDLALLRSAEARARREIAVGPAS